MLLKLIEGVLVLAAIWGVCTQILFPALTRRPWFPFFRAERQEIETEIVAANEAADVEELRKQIPVKKD